MDIGVLARSKTRFWAWMIGPLLLIVILWGAIDRYCRNLERGVAERAALMTQLPEMDARLNAAQTMLNRLLSKAEGKADPAERIRAVISRTAQQCGFVVNSMSVAKTNGSGENEPAVQPAASSASKVLQSVALTLSGEAPLADTIRFLNEVQSPSHLVTVESAELQVMGLATEPLYNGEFTLRYYVRMK